MPRYKTTLSAEIEIEATNVMAAREALRGQIAGSPIIKAIGSHSRSHSSPSGKKHGGMDWDVRVQIKGQRFSPLRRA